MDSDVVPLPTLTKEPGDSPRENRRAVKLPQLTSQQRKLAYERSLELRRRRADVKTMIRSGDVTIAYCFEAEAHIYTYTAGMKVYDLLTSLPAVGDGKARAFMRRAGITDRSGEAKVRQTVRACGPNQTAKLLSLLERRYRD